MKNITLFLSKLLVFSTISASPLLSAEGIHQDLAQAQKKLSDFVESEFVNYNLNTLVHGTRHGFVDLNQLKEAAEFVSKYTKETKRDTVLPQTGVVYCEEIPEWFRIVHQYATTEWLYWQPKINHMHLMPTFTEQYSFIKGKLNQEDGCFYSGLAIAPFSMMLTRTTEKFSIPREDLKKYVDEHYKAHEAQMNEIAPVQNFTADLKRAADVLSHIKDILTDAAISKRGRIS